MGNQVHSAENASCPLQQPNCGLKSGQTECPRCGMRTDVRYVSQYDLDMAVAKGTALCWKNHAKMLEQGSISLVSTSSTDGPVSQRRPKDFEVFRDCPEGPEMVALPSGQFMMGSPDGFGYEDEHPQHLVHIDYRFAIGKYLVTFDEWSIFANETNGYIPHDDGWGQGRQPVINVGWTDAFYYAEWLSKKTGKGYRLLSESEWEYAARAGTTTTYYTGENITTEQANFDGRPHGHFRGRPTCVEEFPPNPWGLHDMLGNVWEWTDDSYLDSYFGAPNNGLRRLPQANWNDRHVLRGDSWRDSKQETWGVPAKWGHARAAARHHCAGGARYGGHGFRLARTLP